MHEVVTMQERTEVLDPSTHLITVAQTAKMCGRSRSGLSKLRLADETFPKPVKLSSSEARNAGIAFVLSEVQDWIKQQKAKRS